MSASVYIRTPRTPAPTVLCDAVGVSGNPPRAGSRTRETGSDPPVANRQPPASGAIPTHCIPTQVVTRILMHKGNQMLTA